MKKKIILFVCKHNMFRSKVAHELFRKYNKNKNFEVTSGGLFKGYFPSPNIMQPKVAKKYFDINLEREKSKGLTIKLLRKVSYIIVVADDVPVDIFKEYVTKGKKFEKWGIKDVRTPDERAVKGAIDSIEYKVKELVKKLK